MKIDRTLELDKLKSLLNQDVIKIVTGIRRCGKSTLLDQFMEYLKDGAGIPNKQIVYINLEDPQFRELNDWHKLYEYVISEVDGDAKYYVIIDEVQQVDEFEKAIDGLYLKKNLDIYITGSNSKLLSSEISTLLSGRFVEIKMTTLSFSQFFQFNENVDEEIALRDYLEYGGFPGAYPIFQQSKASLDDYLAGIFESVIMNDIAKRKKSVDLNILRVLIDFMFNNVGSITSPNNIANSLKASGFGISINTVMNYLSILEDSFVLYKVPRFDIKGKKLLDRLEKYYLVDTSLRRITSSRRENSDIGHAIENIVYFELRRRYSNVWVGKFHSSEIDFVCEKHGGDLAYFQVCYLLADQTVLDREFTPLEGLNDNHPKYVLSLDKFNMSRNGIEHLNLIEWLLHE